MASPSNEPEGRSFDQRLSSRLEARFSRGQRLTRPAQFEAALSTRARARSRLFALHLTQNDQWRLGLVVPKRYEAKAVRRNAIKRIWREAFRGRRGLLEERTARYDLVVRLQARPAAVSLSEFKRTCREEALTLFDELLQRLDRVPALPPCARS